jgi:hypothetical protein
MTTFKFQVGQTYTTPDGSYTVVRRTDKTVWLNGNGVTLRKRINIVFQTETIYHNCFEIEAKSEITSIKGRYDNGTYQVTYKNGVVSYLQRHTIIKSGGEHLINQLEEKSNDVLAEIIDILNNDEMMSKLDAIENIENIDKIRTLRPHPAKTWETWLNHALENFNESRLIEDCPKAITKAYSLTQNL